MNFSVSKVRNALDLVNTTVSPVEFLALPLFDEANATKKRSLEI